MKKFLEDSFNAEERKRFIDQMNSYRKLEKKRKLTYLQKIAEKAFTLRDIESLFNAATLSIGGEQDRAILDKFFTEWKDDKLKEFDLMN